MLVSVRSDGGGQTVMYGPLKAHAHLVCQGIIGHWPLLRHTTGQTTQEQVPSQALSTYKCTNKSKSSLQNSLTYMTRSVYMSLLYTEAKKASSWEKAMRLKTEINLQ